MIYPKEKLCLFLIALMLCTMTIGAVGEEILLGIQASRRAEAFSSDTILQEDLDLILKSGVSTVMQLERQPWQFAAVTDAEVLNDIASASGDIIDPEDDTISEEILEPVMEFVETLADETAINEAPAAIIIYADETASPNEAFDCGAAAQSMILTANALGYGSSVITAPLGVLNGEEHDTWCMQFGVDINMNAVAVLLIGTTEASSDAQYDIEELMFEKVSYVQ